MKPGYVYKSSAKKLAQTKLSHDRHREERRAYQIAYAEAHKEKLAQYRTSYERLPHRVESRRRYNKAYGKSHARAYGLRKRYGLTPEDYDAMLARQGGRCLICGHPPKTRRLNVDHEHRTGRIRGLLCFQCNRQLLPALEHHRHLVERGLLYLDGYLTEPPDEPMRP